MGTLVASLLLVSSSSLTSRSSQARNSCVILWCFASIESRECMICMRVLLRHTIALLHVSSYYYICGIPLSWFRLSTTSGAITFESPVFVYTATPLFAIGYTLHLHAPCYMQVYERCLHRRRRQGAGGWWAQLCLWRSIQRFCRGQTSGIAWPSRARRGCSWQGSCT
jgi:hypothetical protein